MFGLTRLLPAACLLLVGWLFVRRFCKRRKIWLSLWSACLIVVALLSYFFPPERYFVTFSSIDTAYSYVSSGTVEATVSGHDSSFVLGKNNPSSYTGIIFPQKQDGWGFGSGATTKLVSYDVFEVGSVSVYNDPQSEDYYIFVTSLSQPSDVFDSERSVFYTVEGDMAYMYIAAVSAPDQNYALHVNKTLLHPFS